MTFSSLCFAFELTRLPTPGLQCLWPTSGVFSVFSPSSLPRTALFFQMCLCFCRGTWASSPFTYTSPSLSMGCVVLFSLFSLHLLHPLPRFLPSTLEIYVIVEPQRDSYLSCSSFPFHYLRNPQPSKAAANLLNNRVFRCSFLKTFGS